MATTSGRDHDHAAGSTEKRALYIRNVPIDATEAQVADLFRPFGHVERVDLRDKFGAPRHVL